LLSYFVQTKFSGKPPSDGEETVLHLRMRILLGEKNFSPEKCYCKGSNKHFQLSEWFQFWELQFQQPPGKQSVMHMYVNSLTWMHS